MHRKRRATNIPEALFAGDSVREFVAVLRFCGKVAGEKFPGLPNGMRDGVCEMSRMQNRSNLSNEFLPEARPAYFVNAAVAHDGKFTGDRSEVKQHSVAVPGIGHAQLLKPFFGSCHGIIHIAGGNKNADFS